MCISTLLRLSVRKFHQLDTIKLIDIDELKLQIEIRFDVPRAYWFRIAESDVEGQRLPPVFINCYRTKRHIECQTLDLVKLNQRIEDSHQEVILMSDKAITQLTEDIRTSIQPLFRISDSLAMLDMLSAFAHLATTAEYVRPEITRCLAIKAGRHPVREKVSLS
jgi:DNA mismatch repair protein MSH4